METLELLNQYIDNQLVQTQVSQLEKDLREDDDLQKLLDSVVISRQAIRYSALTRKVKELHAQYKDDMRDESNQLSEQATVRALPVQRDYSWVLRIAASLLIGLFGYGGYQYTALNENQVYADKFIPYQLPTTRSSTESLPSLQSLYLSGNYAGVIQQFDALPAKTPGDYFLTGVASLQQHEYDQAIHRFTTLRAINEQHNKAYFKEETDYYLALAYLGAGRADETYTLFKLIRNAPRHLFHESVTELDLVKLDLLRLKK